MEFPETIEEFIEQYSFKDEKQIYTNGSVLLPVFRVKQMIDHYFFLNLKQYQIPFAQFTKRLNFQQTTTLYYDEGGE